MWPNYKHSIMNITNSIYRYYGIKPYHASLPLLDTLLEDKPKHICLMVLDGFGVNLLSKHLQPNDFLNRHVVSTLTSVFPPTTVAATTSILTGLTPYETGYLGWFQYFKDSDLYYTVFLNEDYYAKDKTIPKDFQSTYFKHTPFTETIAKETAVKSHIFYPKLIDKNGYNTIEEGVQSWIDFTFKHAKTVSYFYITEPDLSEHTYGVDSLETKQIVRTLNTILEKAQNHLKENTCVIVTADHGLTNVIPIPLFDYHDLTSMFEHLPANEPRATVFFIKEDRTHDFKQVFNTHFSEHFELFSITDFLDQNHFGFGKEHPNIKCCLGNYIAVAKGPYYFQLDASVTHKGHHAGIKEDEMQVPLIVFTDAKED